MIRYTVQPREPHAHRLTIQCDIPAPLAGQALRLPTWIPGSYLIREFARHVVSIAAEQAGKPVALDKTDKQTWVCHNHAGEALRVTLQVHAWDLSVRGAHFDTRHAFFNGCAVFPEVLGQQGALELVLEAPPVEGGESWQVFTSMTPFQPGQTLPARLTVADYAELLDHPVEMGQPDQYQHLRFTAGGVPHHMVLRGAGAFNATRLQADLARICAAEIGLFGGQAPFPHYLFLTTLSGDGYGGLEHRNSTALLAARDDLPAPSLRDEEPADEAYTRFLGLCAHEYFHAWNVKRLQDAALAGSSLAAEAYTGLLWFFEGVTSYYDDLTLVRSGVISETAYLKLLEKTLQMVNASPGQMRQSLAESSFDAWIKYYRPDENTPNSGVSYYAKGSLLALALDLELRQQGLSLDCWMQQLWQDFGQPGTPLTSAILLDSLGAFAGENMARQLETWVHARAPLPLEPLLAHVGLDMQRTPATGVHRWGIRTASNEGGWVRLTHVLDGSLAQASGLAPGDLLVALDGQRVSSTTLESRLDRTADGMPIAWVVFREDRLLSLASPSRLAGIPERILLRETVKACESILQRRSAWLSGCNEAKIATSLVPA